MQHRPHRIRCSNTNALILNMADMGLQALCSTGVRVAHGLREAPTVCVLPCAEGCPVDVTLPAASPLLLKAPKDRTGHAQAKNSEHQLGAENGGMAVYRPCAPASSSPVVPCSVLVINILWFHSTDAVALCNSCALAGVGMGKHATKVNNSRRCLTPSLTAPPCSTCLWESAWLLLPSHLRAKVTV